MGVGPGVCRGDGPGVCAAFDGLGDVDDDDGPRVGPTQFGAYVGVGAIVAGVGQKVWPRVARRGA